MHQTMILASKKRNLGELLEGAFQETVSGNEKGVNLGAGNSLRTFQKTSLFWKVTDEPEQEKLEALDVI